MARRGATERQAQFQKQEVATDKVDTRARRQRKQRALQQQQMNGGVNGGRGLFVAVLHKDEEEEESCLRAHRKGKSPSGAWEMWLAQRHRGVTLAHRIVGWCEV